MTPQAGGALARAVTDAGGFGMIGFDETESVESLRWQILSAREDYPERAFGISLVHWVIEERPELFDLALACKPRLVCISFGDPEPYVSAKRHDEA
jgi:nitronate monooxygenase